MHWDAARQFALIGRHRGPARGQRRPPGAHPVSELARVAELQVARSHGPRHHRRPGGPSTSCRSPQASGRSAPWTPTGRSSSGCAGSLGDPRRLLGDDRRPISTPRPPCCGPADEAARPDDAGHDRRVDGRPPGPGGPSASTTCPSPAPLGRADAGLGQRRRLRRGVEPRARRPAPVGVPPRAHPPRRVCGPPRPSHARTPAHRVRRRLRAQPGAIEEALGSVDPSALGDQAALQNALSDPDGAPRRPRVAGAAGPATAPRRSRRRGDRLCRPHRRRGRPRAGRLVGPHRRGGAAPAGRGRRLRRLRGAPARPTSAGPRSNGATPSSRACSSGPGRRAWAGSGRPKRCCRRRPRSMLPGCGWPASTSRAEPSAGITPRRARRGMDR